MNDLVTISQAAKAFDKDTHNIRYYIQYERIKKYTPDGEILLGKAKNGELRVSLSEIDFFLKKHREKNQHHKIEGLNEELGFYELSERERTKHVHRLHPYLGKFIPQLVEWFLANNFHQEEIILDPFMGSGTTLVQGNEMGMHTIGLDVSEFNCRIAKVKTGKYDLHKVKLEILSAEKRLSEFSERLTTQDPTQIKLFPDKKLNGLKATLLSEIESEYLNTWFARRTILEIAYYRRLIKKYSQNDLLSVLLSRAVRSSRLVPHYDLATPKAPIKEGVEYWCKKHNKNCKPIGQLLVKIHNYSIDTIRRLEMFDTLRSDCAIEVIQGDSRNVNLRKKLSRGPLKGKVIDGIFTSPPYVGQIDYHDQHIYAYELFGIKRNDDWEIGPKKAGKSKKAREEYVDGISKVFSNVNKYLKKDAKIFIVANDRFNLYPEIAKRSGMKIIDKFHRAVTKRTEQGNNPYQETIFVMEKENA